LPTLAFIRFEVDATVCWGLFAAPLLPLPGLTDYEKVESSLKMSGIF
jgi:hypothetical protein